MVDGVVRDSAFKIPRITHLVALPAWWDIARPDGVHEVPICAAVRQPGADSAPFRKAVVERNEDVAGDGVSQRSISILIGGVLVQVLDG